MYSTNSITLTSLICLKSDTKKKGEGMFQFHQNQNWTAPRQWANPTRQAPVRVSMNQARSGQLKIGPLTGVTE